MCMFGKKIKMGFLKYLNINYLINNFCYSGEGSRVETLLVGFCLKENTLRAF